ncbi:MAG: phage virion morphogenesis protein [Proteobacteria bacterium]|nr:phage virion morphogenesis protein [Pseudomonadota bacterium]
MIHIEADSSHIALALKQLQAAAADLAPAMADIAATLWERVGERFEAQSDPLGKAWEPHAPATLKSYPKDGNRRILDRHGTMLDSLDRRADATSAMVGFGQPYAAYHEYGTNKMPRRGLLFADPEARQLAPEDEQLVIEKISKHLQGAIG